MSDIVWVIDDDDSIRWVLERALQKNGLQVEVFESPLPAMEKLNKERPNAIITDIRMPGMDGISFMEKVNICCPEIPIIVMTAHSDLESAVSAFEGGAFDYLPKPFDVEEAVTLVKRACQSNSNVNEAEADIADISNEIIGSAPAMQEVFRIIGRLSKSNITVLINGESGTGKELVAHALHKHSPRAKKAFIALNMAAIPKDLMEAELFGHEKGAFTGATQMRKGRFEQADGGTLFLDEIGDMPAELQTRLLRVLSDGQFYRIGGHVPVSVDVRIIAATHQNLEDLVKARKFREDLFHRLNVIRIKIPALRERTEDIEALLEYFLNKVSNEIEGELKKVSKDVVQYLKRLPWPGNVRQLENLARWMTVMASGHEVSMDDLPPELKEQDLLPEQVASVSSWQDALYQWATERLQKGEKDLIKLAQPEFESILIKAALEKTKNKRQEAAELLGWGRNTLTRKLAELKS